MQVSAAILVGKTVILWVADKVVKRRLPLLNCSGLFSTYDERVLQSKYYAIIAHFFSHYLKFFYLSLQPTLFIHDVPYASKSRNFEKSSVNKS